MKYLFITIVFISISLFSQDTFAKEERKLEAIEDFSLDEAERILAEMKMLLLIYEDKIPRNLYIYMEYGLQHLELQIFYESQYIIPLEPQ